MKILLQFVVFLFLSNFSLATNYYADPVNGSMANNGSNMTPWGSLEAIFTSGETFIAGDVIFLRNGNHGFPKINSANTNFVDIMAQSGHNPVINRIYIGNTANASYWRLTGLTIQTINVAAYPINLITLYPSTSHIVVQNCTIQSTDNTTNYSRNDWRTKSNNGVRAMGSNHTFQNNIIKNIGVGLSIEAEGCLINGNEIQYFVTDGVRGLASDCIYHGNVIKDNIVVFTYAENHYDGFQSYTCCPVGQDTIRNVILRKNIIINCTDNTRQWRGPMQGMAGFDGFFENWTIENNVIITDHWHGITLLGAINCRIINNTVVDPYDVSPIDPYDIESTALHGPTWISIKAHKDGYPSYGNTIRNNLMAAPLNNDNNIGTVDHNMVIGSSINYNSFFEDTTTFNYKTLGTSLAINAGDILFAPNSDFDGLSRPQGAHFDIGAYEFEDSYSAVFNTIDTTLCYGESIMVGDSTYTVTGNYIDTLLTLNSIDSIITTNLIVQNQIDLSISLTNNQLSVNENNATYQWIDCNSNNSEIQSSSATSQTLIITETGLYAVIVTQNGCIDTSDCFITNYVGLKENLETKLRLYPNPTNGILNIDQITTINSIKITNLIGETVYKNNTVNSKLIELDLQHLTNGCYLIYINTNEVQKITLID